MNYISAPGFAEQALIGACVINERQTVLSDGNVLSSFVRFSWLCSAPPPNSMHIFFFKRELSPVHNTNAGCALATASGSEETGAGWLLHPHINLSSTPLASLLVPFPILDPPPLRRCPAARRLLLSRGFTDTPTETSDFISRQEVKGLSSSSESNPTHLYALD